MKSGLFTIAESITFMCKPLQWTIKVIAVIAIGTAVVGGVVYSIAETIDEIAMADVGGGK